MLSKWQFVVHVDDFGQRLGVGLFANVPVCCPGEAVETQARTRIRHFCEAMVGGVRENGSQ